jgi:hypothetical protein
MTPSEIHDKLAAYADGELDPQTRAEIEAALAADPQLRDACNRWRDLRTRVNHVLQAEPVPAGLADRICAGLREQAAAARPVPRIYRLGVPALAAAAVLMLAYVFWPRTPHIRANYFAEHHLADAVTRHADSLGVRGGVPWDLFKDVDESGSFDTLVRNVSFKCDVPDLGRFDYRLKGACEYCEHDLRVVHAYYRCFADAAPGNLVSLFVVDRPIELCCESGHASPCVEVNGHKYFASKFRKCTVVAWVDGHQTFIACCGIATKQQLIDLAESLRVARQPRPDSPTRAARW